MSDNTTYPSGHENRTDQFPLWVTLMVGLSIGLSSMYYLVARPITQEVATMKSQLRAMHASLDELTGLDKTVGRVNTLLSELHAQQATLARAHSDLATIAKLRQGVEAECQKVGTVSHGLRQLASVLDQTAGLGELTPSAEQTLAGINTFYGRLSETAETTQQAEEVLVDLNGLKQQVIDSSNELDQAHAVAKSVDALQKELARNADGVEAAHESLNQLTSLRDKVECSADGIETAEQTVTGLETLKNQVLAEKDDLDQSHEVLGKLVDLQNDLTDDQIDAAQASQNLDALLAMEQKVRDGADQIAAAMETLDVLTNLGDQLNTQVNSLDRMRRSLVEVVLMENLVDRAVRVLEPLSQLGDLRYITDSEMRAAAQAVIESRNVRIGQNTPDAQHHALDNATPVDEAAAADSEPIDKLVPLPADD